MRWDNLLLVKYSDLHTLSNISTFVHKTFSTDATYVRSHTAVSLHCVCFQISCLVETLTALLASKGLFLLVNYHVFGESPPGGENSSTNRACLRLARARFMNS